MNCSGKFFEPTVTLLLALAEFFWICLPPEAPPPVVLAPVLELFLSLLPHAATATASASTTSAASTARIDFLMWAVLLFVVVGRSTSPGAGALLPREA